MTEKLLCTTNMWLTFLVLQAKREQIHIIYVVSQPSSRATSEFEVITSPQRYTRFTDWNILVSNHQTEKPPMGQSIRATRQRNSFSKAHESLCPYKQDPEPTREQSLHIYISMLYQPSRMTAQTGAYFSHRLIHRLGTLDLSLSP